jgi:signal transduction histidine kinase/ActR/RegA family two-component response regulator
LFSALPSTTGAAFVVAQHLDREHKSLLAELLAKKTTMPVAQIEDGLEPMPNKVFVIPDNQSLTLVDNHFQLAPRDAANSLHRPADVFFTSLAEARAGDAFGGGITIASLANARRSQQPRTANLTEPEKDRRIAQLEHELESTREFLQTTLEAQEALITSKEELSKRNLELSALNSELTHAREIAMSASQRKDEFLAMLAHELRNPLTPITHAIHLLQRESFAGPPKVLYAMIERQTRRLVRLVDDLLDLARINRGHIELRNSLVDLTAVVQDAAESVRFRMETRRHEMRISVPSSPVHVDGDAARLEQVISNVLENAAKYTNPGGRIEVNLTEQGGRAVLSVRDNGIGLAAADLEHIFVLFDQVDRSMTRSGGGLGIGLTLVRRVLELHQGTVEARSAGLGHGTEFIVSLPVSERQELNAQKPSSGTLSALPTRRRSVLIVDDHVDAVETMRMLAQHWGHDVSIAHSGPEAIAAVESFHPEIALIDIGLPGITGYEVARALRERHPEMLLIAMTGHGRDEDQKAAYVAGFDAHLVKPLNLDELQAFMSGGRVSHSLLADSRA